MKTGAKEFIKGEVLKIENRTFVTKVLILSTAYLLISLWLNSVRQTISEELLWVLIIVQFLLYFSIFYSSYKRAWETGHKKFSFLIFVALAILGRVENWEIIIIPLTIFGTYWFSARSAVVSEDGQFSELTK